ncbi:uncharacterized protein LOC100161732 isoform X2 [Acyrthosiphon pisum]|uniref:Uncharacterized protein n=1 Tax=Acyrthosiphon pisum TaxID=7029 RepID=A0A8R2F9R5_ACYPI|nr:uncharacterized protein LOC100161732 isoform X2 [Acyrthosiphon pisum]XP_016661673.1 uncharacterized protein LOC100161732 isoform X2 [Acyrthosiphon pisum]|eukprot:XP_008185188.1 PREDICTED: uncharacterized protein LOC100161732 [Acyrthosiphon pisum]
MNNYDEIMEDVNIVSLDPNYVNELNFIDDSKEELEQKFNDICNSNGKEKRRLFTDQNKLTREQTKIKRMLGQNYTGYHREGKSVFHNTIREKRTLKPACTSIYCASSKNRHCNRFKENERQSMFDDFWKCSWDEKKTYCTNLVSKHIKKQETLAAGEASRRNFSYIYHLKSGDMKFVVCKTMFQNTLGLNEWMVKNWLDSSNQVGELSIKKNKITGSVEMAVDEHSMKQNDRAQKEPTKHTLEEHQDEISPQRSISMRHDHLNSWFDSLAKMPSHYCRQKTNKIYLEGPFISKINVYSAYLQKCVEDSVENPLSRSIFSIIMEKRNLSIFQPRKYMIYQDICDKCSSYGVNQVSDDDYQEHMKQKDRAQEELTKDTLDAQEYKKNVFTMNLQVVKLCPVLNSSALYYSSKLKVHNFTVYNLAPEHQCSSYWLDESEGMLESSVFTSLIIKHLTLNCIKESTTQNNNDIILYSNGCGYQNRNVVLSNALLKFAIQNNIVIEQKFLVEGHTQLPCDSVHSAIESVLKNKEIYLPSDYVKLTKIARQKPNPYDSTLMTHSDFQDYKDIVFYKSIRPGKSKGDPEVRDIRAIKYDPTTQKIYFKLNFDDQYQEIPKYHKAKKKVDINKEVTSLYQNRMVLSFSKWSDLQKLKIVLPRDVHDFYDNLPHKHELKTNRKFSKD